MRSRRLILGLIVLTLLVTVLAAAAKLRATPKYDRIQVGMTMIEVAAARPDLFMIVESRGGSLWMMKAAPPSSSRGTG